jgi:hypothetical protein
VRRKRLESVRNRAENNVTQSVQETES